jgi:2-polyprenyl-3-methyl-5-hydroxy-6-metoxy-1,4-benzoquinol methylase
VIYQDAFGRLAQEVAHPTVAAGRHAFQAADEARIVPDVASKLDVQPDHTLLEVGCGTGNLLLPLARQVREATGLDHSGCIDRMRRQRLPGNVKLVQGTWPETQLGQLFDRILVYSVVHYLLDVEEAMVFIDACVASLTPNGRLLVGDLPNRSKSARFVATNAGQKFQDHWRDQINQDGEDDAVQKRIFRDLSGGGSFIDDEFVFSLLLRWRDEAHETYLLPQPNDLPFGHTREDVLIHRLPK